MPRLASLLLLGLTFLLAACEDNTLLQQQITARNAAIAEEEPGDYFIGRRYYIEHTQFWGYLRRPGQSWDDSKLVIMNENQKLAPDRLQELPSGDGLAHGFDHNREYKIFGHFTGHKVYDPNSDLFLPEFLLTGWEVRNESPGWLFKPNEKYDAQHLLRWEKTD
jgi:hypothetical protein